MSTPDPPNPNNVQPALRRAEAELARRLEEACDDRENIAEESTDELLRLEEELLAAARAVDEAVKLRRKLGDRKDAAPTEAQATAPAAGESPGTRVREFRTQSGSEWRVWEVRPGAGGRPRRPGLYPAEYLHGWLAFEALEGERRKRLPKFGPEWSSVPDADLEHLLDQAVDVPKRKPRSDAMAGSERPPETSSASPPDD
jgi:hypothetical protein